MLFRWALYVKEGYRMPLNTCKVVTKKDDQSAISEGVSCTHDVELHIHMLTCPRQPPEKDDKP
jgi:hypothetical protein